MTSEQNPSHCSNLVELLQWRAREQPDALALAYLDDELNISASLTYRQLERKARSIGAHLSRRVSPGERVLLVYPENIAFLPAFWGCLYAGLVAVPVIFPDPERLPRLLPRIQKIIADSESRLVLAPKEAILSLEPIFGDQLVATDALPDDGGEDWQPPDITPEQISHLQYTSGSIASPKGVMISHANLLHNLVEKGKILGYSDQSISLNWMPHTHDFGLVSGLLSPIFHGIPAYTLTPAAIIRQPIRWLQAIRRYRATHSCGVPFALEYCIHRAKPEELKDLDFSCLQNLTVGAEPIRPDTLERFITTFAPYGLRPEAILPGYGLAEYTLVVTIGELGGKPKSAWFDLGGSQPSRLTACGLPIGGTRVEIVDPDTHQPCPAGQIGEIWVAGPSISPGYWNQPKLNQEIFQARLAPSGEGPFLRTGDLGVFREGDLFITGRLKDMFIIHGQNYYPSDLEWLLEDCHPALAGCRGAAFAIEVDGQEKPVVVHEVKPSADQPQDFEQIVTAMRNTLAERFEMALQAVVLIKRGDLPRTTTGKIRRPATRQAYLEGSLNPLHEWHIDKLPQPETHPETDPLALSLRQIWAEILKIHSFASSENFFALGGDSLSALQMVLSVEEKTGKRIPPSFFIAPTIENLAALLRDESLPGEKTTSESGLQRFRAHPHKRSFGLQHPARFSRFFTFYNHWLKVLCGQKWFQGLILPKQTGWAQHFHQAFKTSMDLPDFTQLTLFSFLTRKMILRLLKHIPLETLLQSVEVHGGSCLLEGHQAGRGVILLTHHNRLSRLVLSTVDSLGIKDLYILRRNPSGNRKMRSRGLKRSSQRLRKDDVALLTQQVLHALEVLSRGGLVVIAADGHSGSSRPMPVSFHGRNLHFHRGFADLGIKSGASIVPVMVWLTPDGSPVITFQSPLQVKTTPTPAEAVDDLIEQYANRLVQFWSDSPWSILPSRMRTFLRAPMAGEDASE